MKEVGNFLMMVGKASLELLSKLKLTYFNALKPYISFDWNYVLILLLKIIKFQFFYIFNYIDT